MYFVSKKARFPTISGSTDLKEVLKNRIPFSVLLLLRRIHVQKKDKKTTNKPVD